MPTPRLPNQFKPSDLGEKILGDFEWTVKGPEKPPIDLTGVPTISDEMARAIVLNKKPTGKQKEYATRMIRKACEEIRRRRGILSLN